MCHAPVGAAVLGVHGGSFVILPFAHGERIGCDSRSRLHVENLRTKLQIDAGQKKHSDDRGFGEVGLEQIGLLEGGAR